MKSNDARMYDVVEYSNGDRFIVITETSDEVFIGNREGRTCGFKSRGGKIKIVGRLEMFDGSATVEKQRDGSTVAKSTGDVDLRDVLRGR